MTAAHCFLDEEGIEIQIPFTTEIRVVLGRVSLSSDEGEEFTGDGIIQVIVHPDYDPASQVGLGNDSDIALIELATESAQRTVQLAGLGEEHLVAPGVLAMATGWGSNAVNELGEAIGEPDILQQVTLPIVDCAETDYEDEEITENMICAGGVPGKDSCTGDSGGPLVAPDGLGGFKQVGVVSFGGSFEQACDVPEFPGVFVKVSNFVSWVSSVPALVE